MRSEPSWRRGAATAALLAVLSATACSSPATAPTAPSSQATDASEGDAAPNVPRASQSARQKAADAMQQALDYYKGLWEAARRSSQYPSDTARSKDTLYTDLLDSLNKDVVGQADSAAIPILSGKSMDDWNTWTDWVHNADAVQTDLLFWAGGNGTEAAAKRDLAAAEADIGRLRQ